MKYDTENLQKVKGEVAKLKSPFGYELHHLITRCIVIKQELEELDIILATPRRTEEDILKHMRLIKEYKQNRDRQIDILLNLCKNVQGISLVLAQDYENTIDIIKA